MALVSGEAGRIMFSLAHDQVCVVGKDNMQWMVHRIKALFSTHTNYMNQKIKFGKKKLIKERVTAQGNFCTRYRQKGKECNLYLSIFQCQEIKSLHSSL